jgi:hypothetical protein
MISLSCLDIIALCFPNRSIFILFQVLNEESNWMERRALARCILRSKIKRRSPLYGSTRIDEVTPLWDHRGIDHKPTLCQRRNRDGFPDISKRHHDLCLQRLGFQNKDHEHRHTILMGIKIQKL